MSGAPAAQARYVRQPGRDGMVTRASGLLIVACGCAPTQVAHVPPDEPSPTSCVSSLSTDTTVYDTTQVSEKPVRRDGPRPEYPEDARSNRVQGRVILTLVVEPTGQVNHSSVRALQTPDYRLTRSAATAARASRYWPGCRGGMAVRVRLELPIVYSIHP